MIELPEAYVLAKQLNETVAGRTIVEAEANQSPHGFAFYNQPVEMYNALLAGQTIVASQPGAARSCTCGGNVDIVCTDKMIVISTPIRYIAPGGKLPAKHQLRLLLDDGASITCTVQMWGAMLVCEKDGTGTPAEWYTDKDMPGLYAEAFDYTYFKSMAEGKGGLSAKAFLATEQRIPGLGNGVLQDILYNARIHPRTRLDSLSETQFKGLYDSTKATTAAMRDEGGRDTEKDIFWNAGGYKTKLSAKTKDSYCQICGGPIVREAYLGGNVYFCPTCQPYSKAKSK